MKTIFWIEIDGKQYSKGPYEIENEYEIDVAMNIYTDVIKKLLFEYQAKEKDGIQDSNPV